MTPAQSKGPALGATELSLRAAGGFMPGAGAYLRVGIAGFTVEDGVTVAVVHPINKDGTLAEDAGSRSAYYVPVTQLIAGKMVVEELKG